MQMFHARALEFLLSESQNFGRYCRRTLCPDVVHNEEVERKMRLGYGHEVQPAKILEMALKFAWS